MADRAILFSAPMVRALLDGRKTQTRRVAKITAIMGNRVAVHPPEELIELDPGEFKRGVMHYLSTGALSGPYDIGVEVGDRLYVREEYYQRGHWEPIAGAQTKGGKQKWAFAPADDVIAYDPPSCFRGGRHHHDPATVAWHKRLARFMPRAASRITLLVTDVRVERLQDCSEADAIAEGIDARGVGSLWGWIDYLETNPNLTRHYADPRRSYASLWDSINGPGAWEANPWVVAVTFDVVRGNIDQIGGVT
ncbi:hypothetical protein J2Y54_000538 [Sphingomonas sp. BE123]|uniref:hypothetical protein n=1 Tax=Sphingomonas sp. BE123 TaxID=2817842 RepID=UPI0028561524|nr:hypothetical protein [Sphingomonas sp. BE123]MDR6851045.1 hypothetical protein [Sphingomonas sp. BE123]